MTYMNETRRGIFDPSKPMRFDKAKGIGMKVGKVVAGAMYDSINGLRYIHRKR